MMNEAFNSFRSVSLAEVENDHLFRSMRHFPQLARSLSAVKALQLENGRDFNDTKRTKAEKPRVIQRKSTHKLESLKTSVLGEINHISKINRILLTERGKQREALAAERALSMGTVLKVELTPLVSAEKKLANIAIKYDARRMNNDLAGFIYGPELTYDEFDTQLRRCLNINLSNEELHALFHQMDSDGNKHIDGVEFTRYFFDLGYKERDRIRLEIVTRLDREKKRELELRAEGELRQKEVMH